MMCNCVIVVCISCCGCVVSLLVLLFVLFNYVCFVLWQGRAALADCRRLNL